MNPIINAPKFTRFYYGEDGGEKYGNKNALFTDNCSASKVFDLIEDNSFIIEMFIGYYPEGKISQGEYLIGKKHSIGLSNFKGLVAPYRFKKFIEGLVVSDYTYIRKDDGVVFDSGLADRIKIILPQNDTSLLVSFLQRLDVKNMFKPLIENKNKMLKLYNDGSISIDKIELNEFWEGNLKV